MPVLYQSGQEVRGLGEMRVFPLALAPSTRTESCRLLNRVLADSTILYNLYKKHHWLLRGPAFYQLHLLLDKHAEEQLKVIDLVGERIHAIGGIAVADPRHVAEVTTVPRPPDGFEEVPAMLSRLLEAHEIVIRKVREAIDRTADGRDDGTTTGLLLGEILRTNELQVWFVADHLADVSSARS
ncbi:MAG TPA: DNA starvation/stationary phase protection protein [Actinomadura sp.]|jgi:starvation-inducible DNA-binding protein|nr:DNA starvation/stationary phase protection protein [Actinomadura sp.]